MMWTAQPGGIMNATAIMTEALGPGLSGVLDFAFSAMNVAEEVLADRYDNRDDEPAGAFAALRPRADVFAGRANLLPSHMREILDRLDAGEDVAPATDAECCCALAEMSQKAPLRHEWYLAYVKAFVGALGSEGAYDVLGTDVNHNLEGYDKSVLAQEALAGLRTKLADPDRRATS